MIDLQTLGAIPLFAGLTEAQLAAVLRIARSRQVPGGTVILREGDHGDSLFVLVSGAVEVFKQLGLPGSRRPDWSVEKTLVRIPAPHFFGEMGLVGETERSATVIAHADCELLEIGKAEFDRLAESDLLLGYHLIRNIAAALSARLRHTDQDVLKLTIALSLALGNR